VSTRIYRRMGRQLLKGSSKQWRYRSTMREIDAEKIQQKVKELFLRANFYIGADVVEAIQEASVRETSPIGRSVLEMILKNYEVASSEEVAICQDTGLAILFIELGQEVHVKGSFVDAINEGVKEAYTEGYLRKSAVDDPVFDRKNTRTNCPAIIYTDIVPGDRVKFLITPKGFGSENMSALSMMKPADGPEGIVDFIVSTVEKAGPNPCPPTVVGVGIGGTADMAFKMAKKATLREIGRHNPDERYARMERDALERINDLGIGPAGLGGNTTSLWVSIDDFPTHIAGMPVAVNICCHAARHASGEL
jgi:fumarate hydratase subunit alpha